MEELNEKDVILASIVDPPDYQAALERPEAQPVKRGRGRPRKHPPQPPRLKTGPLALRFVDEAKPTVGHDDETKKIIRSHVMAKFREIQKTERVKVKEQAVSEGKRTDPGLCLPRGRLPSPRRPFDLCEFDDALGNTNEFNEIRKHMLVLFSQEDMTAFAFPYAAHNSTFFAGLACIAYAHLDSLHNRPASSKALAVKTELTKRVNENLSHPESAVSIGNIAAVTALASAANVYDLGIGVEYFSHARGLEILIATRGGLHTLTQDPLGTMMWKLIILHNYVLCATFNLDIPLREALADEHELEAPRPLTPEFEIAESPLYCPRYDFMTLPQSTLCTPHTLRLIKELHNYVAVIEAESLSNPEESNEIFAHRLTLRTRLLNFPSNSSPAAPASLKNDYIYESVRISGLILLRLSDTCLPVQLALAGSPPTPTGTSTAATSSSNLIPALVRAMRSTPLLNGWADMPGVLSFVCLVGTCGARGKPEFAFISSVGMRCMFDMCCIGKHWTATIKTIQRFIWLQRVLLQGGVRRVDVENVGQVPVPLGQAVTTI